MIRQTDFRNEARVDRLRVLFHAALFAAVAWMLPVPAAAENWRGLVVAPENRCSPYNRRDYPYSQSVERRIADRLGGYIGPYTGRRFSGPRDTDIEHMVAVSEAHDSGLCAADAATRRRFASDLLNLTLAGPRVNRRLKRHHDAADWMPPMNRCWFADRVLQVRLKYGLTIDRREANALERVLSACASTELVLGDAVAAPAPPTRKDRPSSAAPERWDDNRNGRISCREARRHGIAPVRRGHPAYPFMRDADGDGVVCE